MQNSNSIDSILLKFPTANLLQSDVIIHRLPRISSLTGYNIHILRDDLTGFGTGGNKTRKLDYLFGDALAKKADTAVTFKATSFSRNAAFAAKTCGIKLHVVIPGIEVKQNRNSQDVFNKLDAKLHFVPDDRDTERAYRNIVNGLRNEGKIVYELHPGGSDPIGTLGYLNAFNRIVRYSLTNNLCFSDIVLSIGSAGTQAGLIIGQYVSGYDVSITGITARLAEEKQHEMIHELVLATSRMLSIAVRDLKIRLDDHFVGPGYAIPSDEGEAACKLFAEREGILLDHVYTAKAAAALLRYASDRKFIGENILFVHTGGNAGLYY
jgi:1-aminocyclopropane-1-carboxylate deaminase/D-cysteine desulfhydrase-like pyridoxal-dependent ACC family enzyme